VRQEAAVVGGLSKGKYEAGLGMRFSKTAIVYKRTSLYQMPAPGEAQTSCGTFHPPSHISAKRTELVLHTVSRIARRTNIILKWRFREHGINQAPSRFHHFQPGIEFMSAGRTVDHIRLDTQLVRPDPHASAIRAPSELDLLIVQGLVLHAT